MDTQVGNKKNYITRVEIRIRTVLSVAPSFRVSGRWSWK
jgi:hypothetical protein